MCLGQVAQVVAVGSDGTLRVRVGDAVSVVSPLVLTGDVAVGDWLVVHSGYALERVSAAEAEDALRLRGAARPIDSPPEVRP